MAHYALIDQNNLVVQVINGRDENEVVDGISDWESYYSEVSGLKALRTSYNTIAGVHYTFDANGERIPSQDQSKAFRKNYAGTGFTYDEQRDAFIPPKEHESFIFNEETCQWDPPSDWPNPEP